MRLKISTASRGQVLIFALILLIVVMIISAAMFSQVTRFLQAGSRSTQWEQATVIADGGADYAVFKLNTTQGYSGNPAISLGAGTFKIDIQDVAGNKKITSTGCIPSWADCKIKRIVKVEVVKITTTPGTLPDTGRTTCNNGTAPPCTGSGQDADYTSANSATCDPNFTANGDGTVTDNCTNLTWQKCTRGQDPITCSGTVSTTGWTSALSYCQGLSLAGSGWRMPNFKELQSIVNYQSGLAGIDPTIFPNTDPDRYWSSTAGSTAWVVNFPEEPGAVDMLQVSTSFSERIRCVRDAG